MIELLMLLTLSPMNQPTLTAQVQPCVWPNPCGVQEETVELAGYTICVWPNPCGSAEPVQVASDYEICAWPRKCGNSQADETISVATTFKPCVWPNPCGAATKESALI